MEELAAHIEPLVSVVITCYNHGKYLHKSIGSIVEQQGYSNYEIILVDDGSTDDTKVVALQFPAVKYVFQQNAGLSAARNTGIKNSSGKWIIFLDADDWLLPSALAINSSYLQGQDDIAFVSGAYQHFFEEEQIFTEVKKSVQENHYCAFLQGNYIGMHAAVMYQKKIFEQTLFDTGLKACEDYDVYLKISRDHPVIHHTEFIAVYRIHGTNMSGNPVLMVNSSLQVLKRQENALRNEEEKECFFKGIEQWKSYYGYKMYERLQTQLSTGDADASELKALQLCDDPLYREIKKKIRQKRWGHVKNSIPPVFRKLFSKTNGQKKGSL